MRLEVSYYSLQLIIVVVLTLDYTISISQNNIRLIFDNITMTFFLNITVGVSKDFHDY